MAWPGALVKVPDIIHFSDNPLRADLSDKLVTLYLYLCVAEHGP